LRKCNDRNSEILNFTRITLFFCCWFFSWVPTY